jgi:hypothetical protein
LDLEDGLDGWWGLGVCRADETGDDCTASFLTLRVHEVRDRIRAAQVRKQRLATEAGRSHEEYWNRTSPEKKFKRAFCIEGWDVGFSDEMKFFSMRAEDALDENAAGGGNGKIRCSEIWVQKRWVEKRLLDS